MFSMVQVCFSADLCSISPETITGSLSSENGFAWRYGYDIEFTDNKVYVNVAIDLIPAGGVTKPELDRIKPSWEKGIEEIWSGKFALVTPSGQQYPIIIDAHFKGHRFHHKVIVHPECGRSDELNWNIFDSPLIAAHEFGHMLGAFDEYMRGATASQSGIIDNTSIMTCNPTHGVTYERHYQRFLSWFVQKTRLSNVRLLSIDNVRNWPDNKKQAKYKR